MAVLDLLVELVKEIAVYVAMAFFVARLGVLQRLAPQPLPPRQRLAVVAVCGGLCILGTYWGIWVQGALANTRVIGAVLAGFLGGPWAGLAAGLIGGLHRLSLGGFTALACGVSTTTEGLLAGLVKRRLGARPVPWVMALAVTAAAELLQMAIILLMARPFADAWALVRVIALPMIFANSIGAGLVMAIINDSREHQERVKAAQAKKALEIASRTLPYLRAGLTRETAQAVAEIIRGATGVAAASITDGQVILGYAGAGADHHTPGTPPLTAACREVLADGKMRVLDNVGCAVAGCPLTSGVVVPLKTADDQVVGTLNLFQRGSQPISPVIVELAAGLGQLLSTQIEIARLQALSQLVVQAELRALHAQINPHFLFNALNAVAALCRRDPAEARQVVISLSQYLRSSIRAGDNAIVTLGEELEVVRAYLAIEQVRYGDRLRFAVQVPPDLLAARVPIFSLQPLVENSVRHGLMPKPAGGTVVIGARREGGSLVLWVQDDGVGMGAPAPRPGSGGGVGLRNVQERIRYLYGPAGSVAVASCPGEGTRVEIRLPLDLVEEKEVAAVGG